MSYETRPEGLQYETVAASQTAQVLGATGRTGGILHKLVIVPATSAAGAVSIVDGSTSIQVFAGGGITALADLKPIVLDLNVKAAGQWKITTGANVACIGIGWFD